MALDSDVVLLGTGLAPLVAAYHLQSEGYSVLLLNPDRDFFLEDSELPFDPLLPETSEALCLERVAATQPERVLEALRPSFPGAVEYWSESQEAGAAGFHDVKAPHVRQRARLWTCRADGDVEAELPYWDLLESLYLEASDSDLNPLILEGLQAVARFPGTGQWVHGNYRSLYLSKFSDVDVVRYRNGLLEFVRERLGEDRVICGATQIERLADGIRFHTGEEQTSVRAARGVLAFWTPRLSQWLVGQIAESTKHGKSHVRGHRPEGVRVWEEWSLVSRELLDPRYIGTFKGMAVWAETEGVPGTRSESLGMAPLHRLSVLRAGPLLQLHALNSPEHAESWAPAEAFEALAELRDFLGWSQFSIRAMRSRILMEWGSTGPWRLAGPGAPVFVVPRSDGAIVDVVCAARAACELLPAGEGE